MNIDQIKQVFTSAGKQVTECGIDGYYQVSGSSKHRSLRSLQREAKTIEKQMKKAAKRGAA